MKAEEFLWELNSMQIYNFAVRPGQVDLNPWSLPITEHKLLLRRMQKTPKLYSKRTWIVTFIFWIY